MELVGLPSNWNGLGIVGILIFLLWMIATGKLLFRWQVDRLFKDKDQVIEKQSRQIELQATVINEVVPPVTKLLEKLNEKAEQHG